MEQQNIDFPITDFEQITANQIAIERGYKNPSDQNLVDARRLVNKWNLERMNLELETWK